MRKWKGTECRKSQLEMQIALETEAVERYKKHIEIIDDAEVSGVLKHILDEEKRHRKEFRIRLEKCSSVRISPL